MPEAFTLQITREEATALAGGPVTLHYYPLTGVSFEVRASRGPAARIDGRVFHTVGDYRTGSILTTVEWDVECVDEMLVPVVETDPAKQRKLVMSARHSLTTVLMRKLRLGGRFQLDLVEVIDPLWKPNWLHEDGNGLQVLVDGLDGSVASRVR